MRRKMDKWLVFTFAALILWGVAPILEKLALRNCDALSMLFIRSITISAILLLIIGIQIPDKFRFLQLKTYFYVVGGGICGGLLGMLMYFKALESGPASSVVPITAAYPMVTSILSILILREALNIVHILGIILITAGIVLVSR